MIESDDLLPKLRGLLSYHSVRKLSGELLIRLRFKLANMFYYLSIWSDSKSRMIERGFLSLLADICRTHVVWDETDSVLFEHSELAVRSVAITLLCLGESRECVKKMKQAGAISLFEPFSSLLESKIPGSWRMISAQFAIGGKLVKGRPGVPDSRWKTPWQAARSGFLGIPTVCSWEECEALPDMENKTPFSKCACCKVAHYCRYVFRSWPGSCVFVRLGL